MFHVPCPFSRVHVAQRGKTSTTRAETDAKHKSQLGVPGVTNRIMAGAVCTTATVPNTYLCAIERHRHTYTHTEHSTKRYSARHGCIMDLNSATMHPHSDYAMSNHQHHLQQQQQTVPKHAKSARRSKKLTTTSPGRAPVRKFRKKSVKWSHVDRMAFEEAISLIPKYTAKNIPICGAKYGRGRYISMYIRQKTGSSKSAGQIASHLQVMARAHKGTSLHDMIVYGPGESQEVCENFIRIFTKIIASNPSILNVQDDETDDGPVEEEVPQKRVDNENPTYKKSVLKKLEMVYINLKSIGDSHTFSTVPPNLLNKELSIISFTRKEIQDRFSMLMTLSQNKLSSSDAPLNRLTTPLYIAHVGIHQPHHLSNINDGQFNFQTKVLLPDLTKAGASLGVITMITYEDRVICQYFEQLECQRNRNKNDISISLKIGTEFWKKYYKVKNSSRYDMNKIQIQQLVVSYEKSTATKKFNLSAMDKSDIKYLFHWDFEEVNEFLPAYTQISEVTASEDVGLNRYVEELIIPSDDSFIPQLGDNERRYKSSGEITPVSSRPQFCKANSFSQPTIQRLYSKILTPPTTAEYRVNNGRFPEHQVHVDYRQNSHHSGNEAFPQLQQQLQPHTQPQLQPQQQLQTPTIPEPMAAPPPLPPLHQYREKSLLCQVAQNQALSASQYQHGTHHQPQFLSKPPQTRATTLPSHQSFTQPVINRDVTSSPIPQIVERKMVTPLSSFKITGSFTNSFEASLYDLDPLQNTNVTDDNTFPNLFENVTEIEAGTDIDILAIIDDHMNKQAPANNNDTDNILHELTPVDIPQNTQVNTYPIKAFPEPNDHVNVQFAPFNSMGSLVSEDKENMYSYGYSG